MSKGRTRISRAAISLSVFTLLFAGLGASNPVPAAAHYHCDTPVYVAVFYDPSIGSSIHAIADLSCDHTHYIIQGRLQLQMKSGRNWIVQRDTGTVSYCCDLYRVPDLGIVTRPFAICIGDNTWRAVLVYIETISHTGNIAHRSTNVISATKQTTCS